MGREGALLPSMLHSPRMLLGHRRHLHHEPLEMTVQPVPTTVATASAQLLLRATDGCSRMPLKVLTVQCRGVGSVKAVEAGPQRTTKE